jgi:hypothetical protein
VSAILSMGWNSASADSHADHTGVLFRELLKLESEMLRTREVENNI